MNKADAELNSGQTVAVVKAIYKSFPNGATALAEVDFQISAGEIVGLIGANGSGKTTMLKAISGAVDIDSGIVNTFGASPRIHDSELNTRLAYVSQQSALDPEMTVKETLHFFCALYNLNRSNAEQRINELSTQLDLKNEFSKRVNHLSGGFRQRLNLAVSLLHSPKLILADEPTAALDPASREFVWNYLVQLINQGASIVIVTHDLVEADRHCTRIAMLSTGKKLIDAPPAEIVREHGLTLLEADCENPPDQSELDSISELVSPVIIGNRVVTLLSEPNAETVLNSFGDLRSYHIEKPSLATAYRKLSGKFLNNPGDIGPPFGSGKGRGNGDGGRGRRNGHNT